MSSYLDYALTHNQAGNSFVNFFSSRAKFSIAIVEKVVNLVQSLFKLILVEALPAIVNYLNSRSRAEATGKDVLNGFRDIPVAIVGLIFGQSAAVTVNNALYGKVTIVTATV